MLHNAPRKPRATRPGFFYTLLYFYGIKHMIQNLKGKSEVVFKQQETIVATYFGYWVASSFLAFATLKWLICHGLHLVFPNGKERVDHGDQSDINHAFLVGVAVLVLCWIFDGMSFAYLVDFCRTLGCEFTPLW